MDKKTGIGIGLIFLLIILIPFYQRLLNRIFQTTPPPIISTDTIKTSSLPDEDIPAPNESMDTIVSEPNVELLLPDTTRPIVFDTLENEWLQVVISNQGGLIHALYLKHYETIVTDSQRFVVQLIQQDSSKAMNHILFLGAQQIDLSHFFFDFQKTTTRITATAKIPVQSDTLEFTKIFQFGSREYSIDYQYKVKTTHKIDKHLVVWDGAMNPSEIDIANDMGYFKAFTKMGEIVAEEDIADDKEMVTIERNGQTHWIALKTKFFLTAMITRDIPAAGLILKGQKYADNDRYMYGALLFREKGLLANQITLYAGPMDYSELKSLDIMLDKTVSMGNIVIKPFSYLITWMLIFLNKITSDFGLIIIIFSFVIKIITYPLTHKSYEASKRMSELQPKIQELKERFKDDPQKFNSATMQLYKTEKINPLGGCLPLILQMPIFFALYRVFDSTIMLRNQDFLWINNLAIKDPTYILPIAMGVLMLAQNMQTMKDPKQKFMIYLMPVMMVFFFKDLSAGLVLYWSCFNFFTIIQQELVNRFWHGKATQAVAKPAPTSTVSQSRKPKK